MIVRLLGGIAIVLAAVAAFFWYTVMTVENNLVYTGRFSNVALQGHDAVAYHTDGAPVKGTAEYATTFNGAEFRFATEANLQAFEADPAAYAPQYGGHCAWAVSQGYAAKGDAKHWRIVDDKLYLNFNAEVQETWETDIDGFIASAQPNWPQVFRK